MPSRKVEANAKNKDRIEVFKQTYGLIRVALAYQNGQGGTAVVISCFSVCHLVVEVQFLRVRPMDGTVATGIQCQAVQMVSGFFEALEYLLPQPSIVLQLQVFGTGNMEHCSPHKGPVVQGWIGQIPDDVVVVAEIDGAFFFDAYPCQHPRNVFFMIFQDSLFCILLVHVLSFSQLTTSPYSG